MPIARVFLPILTAVTAAILTACGDATTLTPATEVNTVDTTQLFALRGTPVSAPSGYDIPSRSATRTDTPNFDFAFDISDAGTPLLYPAGALGLSSDPGLVRIDESFDDVESAPTEDYVLNESFEVGVGTVFVGRSRPSGSGCILTGALPRYGKFRVLAIDLVQRSITLETLVNQNCGYRALQPGLPTD